jgi:cystine transport system permease protein
LILYIEVALIYLVVSSVLSSVQGRLERHFSRSGGTIETAS